MLFEYKRDMYGVDGEWFLRPRFYSSKPGALWIEGVLPQLSLIPPELSDEKNYPVFRWARSGGKDWEHPMEDAYSDILVSRVGSIFLTFLLVCSIGLTAYHSWWWLILGIPAALFTTIWCAEEFRSVRGYRRLMRAFKSGKIYAIQLDPDLVNAVRSLLESNLNDEVCRAFEKRHDEIPRCKRVVNTDRDSVTHVIAQNPALAEFLSKELNAELPSPPEYRRSAFDALYKCIQTEIDRLTTNKRILEEQQILEDKRRKMEEDLRRTREERNALAAAEADRISRILALPSILGESKEEVEMFGSISQEMCELGSQDSTRVASEQA